MTFIEESNQKIVQATQRISEFQELIKHEKGQARLRAQVELDKMRQDVAAELQRLGRMQRQLARQNRRQRQHDEQDEF